MKTNNRIRLDTPLAPGAHDSARSKCLGAGAGWHRLTRLGSLAALLILAACGGNTADGSEVRASVDPAGGGTGGTASTNQAAGADGEANVTSVAPISYEECHQGTGGCPSTDPLCLSEHGVVSDATTTGNDSTLLYEVCTRECETDSDCPADTASDARPRCVEEQGQKACTLDCSDGALCPPDMVCSHLDSRCVYSHLCDCYNNCDVDSTFKCVGDCLGQLDVTCVRDCTDASYECTPN